MGNISGLVSGIANVDSGGCPSPFISEDLHPFTGGWRGSRNCQANILSTNANASRCCLPCPLANYVYSDNFQYYSDKSSWGHVASLILCTFILLTMIVLPHESRRSYLNIVLVIGVIAFNIAFVVPLARQPPQCYDAVTQHGLHSNGTCAFSGGLAAFSSLFLIVWIMIRALFMHLQICWDITPRMRSYIAGTVVGLTITIILTTIVLVRDGIAMRFGHYCFVNLDETVTFWGWLLAFAGVAFLLQIATFVYVIQVYIASAVAGGGRPLTNKSGSFKGSSKSRNARITARRVRTVLTLQWRPLAIVSLAIFHVAFVALAFVINNDKFTKQDTANNGQKLFPWILCLVTSQNKDTCLKYIRPLIVTKGVVLACLYLLATVGVWGFFLLIRVEMFTGWWELVRKPFWKRRASTSTDAGSFVNDMAARSAMKGGRNAEPVPDKGVESFDSSRQRPIPDEEQGPLGSNPPEDPEKFHAK